MTLSVPQRAVVGNPDRMLMLFETTGADVFATLCRISVGDLAASERLFVKTYHCAARRAASEPDVELDRDALVSMAATAFLADGEEGSGARAPTVLDAGDLGWSHVRWAPALDALRALDRRARVMLALVEMEGRTSASVAELLGTSADEVDACRTVAQAHLAESLVTDPTRDVFAHAELWLDDTLRDRVRRDLDGSCRGTTPPRRRRVRPARSSVTRARFIALIGGLLAGTLAVAGVRWLESAPSGERGVGSPIAAAPPPTTAKPRALDPGDVVEAIPVLDLQLAGDLANQAIVPLDSIVRYPKSQAVGVSWTGPCNRPAARVTFTQAANGIGVQLRTGSFPVVSCVGMPQRWTLVVEEYLGDGTILPVTDGRLDRTFRGASVDRNQTAQALPGRLYGSALVDASNRPWVYPGRNCGTFGFVRRQSPDGAMFEVRTGLVSDASVPAETVGSVSCLAIAIPRVLYGPNGSVFPQTDLATGRRIPPDPASPRDCHGPFASATDVPAERPFTTQFYDGDWSTWDGCLVPSTVIFSRHLAAECESVRTITFADTIGERIGPVERTHTYVRDPQRLLSRDIPPLLHYARVPGDGIDSGFRFGTDQLWYSPSTADAIYVVTTNDVERWPLVAAPPRCNG